MVVTGVECAGLVLAVLPLFISAAEAYSKRTEPLWGVLLRYRADEALQVFYCEFYWQIGLLHEQLKSISDALADEVQIDHNEEPITTQLKAWKNNPAIKQALITLLGSEASFQRFETATMSIVRLLGQLLRERKTASKPLRKVYFENDIGYSQRADSFRALSQITNRSCLTDCQSSPSIRSRVTRKHPLRSGFDSSKRKQTATSR
jgi:hypothetical protein